MRQSRRDYIVEFMREERIAETVASWLVMHLATFRDRFCIIQFIEKTLLQKLKKGPFVIEFYQEKEEPDPAYVTFDPFLILHVAREVWERARRGDWEAIKILLHEVGHMVLHDRFAKEVTYSDAEVAGILSFPKERSAEWQAITFSEVGCRFLSELQDLNPSDRVLSVWSRLSPEVQDALGPLPDWYQGDSCSECGNFTLVRNGVYLKCDTCGSTTGCS